MKVLFTECSMKEICDFINTILVSLQYVIIRYPVELLLLWDPCYEKIFQKKVPALHSPVLNNYTDQNGCYFEKTTV